MSSQTRRTVGLYGGSYDPVHRGHLAVASHAVAAGHLDEVWLTVSPENPFKSEGRMASARDRLAMARMAVDAAGLADCVKVSDIELDMPRPSYTVDTLRLLSSRNPDTDFRVIIGADNVADFHKWRDYREIIDRYGVLVYPRPGYDIQRLPFSGVILKECPLTDVSSTRIRRLAAAGETARQELTRLVEPCVADYILSHGLYQGDVSASAD